MSGNRFDSKLIAGLVALSMMLVAVPTAVAQSSGFGQPVAPQDTDTTYVLTDASEPTELAFVDDDGDGRLDSGESVYLTTDSTGDVQGNDVRLANAPNGDLGSQVRASDSDFGNPYTQIDTSLTDLMAFFDADGDGSFSTGDTLFLDIEDASGTITTSGSPDDVSVNDIVLTGDNAGDIVTSNHPLLNNGLDDSFANTLAVEFFDADGDSSYDIDDIIFINLDDSESPALATIQDIPLGVDNFGSPVGPEDPETTYVLTDASEPDELAFVDDDGDGRLDSGESVYVTTDSTGDVQGNDVRLTNAPTGNLGSQVRASDSDFGNPYTQIDTTFTDLLAFFDADGDGSFSTGDTLFLDIEDASGTITTSGSPDDVSVNDIVLNGDDAGSIVTSNHPLLNNGLDDTFANTPAIQFFDGDGDSSYDIDDVVYININDGAETTAQATVQDVRLGGGDFGTVVGSQEFDTTYVLADASEPDELAFVDDDGDGRLDSGESVYLTTDSTGDVQGNDVRLTNPPTGNLGSQVRASDSDFGNPYTQIDTSLTDLLAFFDADGDGSFSTGDTLFLDIEDASGTITTSGSPDDVSVNDIVVTGDEAGSIVTSNHPLLNNGLDDTFANTPAIQFFDGDGDSSYDIDDVVYININDGAETTPLSTIQDVRLGGEVTQADTGGQDDTNDADGDGVVDSNDDCPDEAGDAANNGCPEDDDLNQTEPDADGDGVPDGEDNCPNTSNPGQNDRDNDGMGNACDDQDNRDPDGDGVENFEDNCANTSNAQQNDRDNDGVGNACDNTDDRPDADGDGIVDANDDCAQEAGPEANNGCPEDTGTDGGEDGGTDGGEDGTQTETPAVGAVAALAVIAAAAALLRRD